MNWRDPQAQMSVEQRALAAMGETVASDAAMRAPLRELLAAFGHACAAAAEGERDTALDQLSDELRANAKAAREAAYWRDDHGGKLAAAEGERDALRSQLRECQSEQRDDEGGYMAAVATVKAQRDALLAALRTIANLADGDGRDTGFRRVITSQAKDVAREAIAAAEGKR